jgi:hypothetical protein
VHPASGEIASLAWNARGLGNDQLAHVMDAAFKMQS